MQVVVVMMCADQMRPDTHRGVQQEAEDMVRRPAVVQEDREDQVSHPGEIVAGRRTESLQVSDHNH